MTAHMYMRFLQILYFNRDIMEKTTLECVNFRIPRVVCKSRGLRGFVIQL